MLRSLSWGGLRLAQIVVLAVLASVAVAGCGTDRDGAPADVTLTPAQRRVADQLVAIFENGTTEPRYDYVEDLGDGRGYTCGKIGFTTSSTEVRDVVEAYAARRPVNPLAPYLPRLRELAATGDGAVAGLSGFPGAWAGAASDPSFRQVQDAVADRFTYEPAVAIARRVGVRTALGVAILFDTAVQHGVAEDPDGLPSLVSRASAAAGGDPAGGVAEPVWLNAFLDLRAETLRRPSNAATQRVWAESVDRVEALRRLLTDDREDLQPPLTVTVFGARHELR
jgi:chitosanase